MTCAYPQTAWRLTDANGALIPNRRIVFGAAPANSQRIQVPCGKCHYCRSSKQREIAIRCSHEMRMHEHNTWLTLTYDDDHLPLTTRGVPTLVRDHASKFIRALRQKLKRLNDGIPVHIKYFGVGEYGERTGRPHYHIIIFGWQPTDKAVIKSNPNQPLYKSPFLDSIWGNGHVTVADASYGSALYTAKYTAKLLGWRDPDAAIRPSTTDPDYNPLAYRIPEYSLFSKGRTHRTFDKETGEISTFKTYGIGGEFFHLYSSDFTNTDTCVTRNQQGLAFKSRVPRYYDKLREQSDPVGYLDTKAARHKKALSLSVDETELQRQDAVKIHLAELKQADKRNMLKSL